MPAVGLVARAREIHAFPGAYHSLRSRGRGRRPGVVARQGTSSRTAERASACGGPDGIDFLFDEDGASSHSVMVEGHLFDSTSFCVTDLPAARSSHPNEPTCAAPLVLGVLEPLPDELGMFAKGFFDQWNIDRRVFVVVARRHQKRLGGIVTTALEVPWIADYGIRQTPWCIHRTNLVPPPARSATKSALVDSRYTLQRSTMAPSPIDSPSCVGM